MSLFETGRSTGSIARRAMLRGDQARSAATVIRVGELAELVAVGGWPGNLQRRVKQSLQATRDSLEEIRRVDLRRADGRSYDPVKVGRVLRSLARHVATEASIATGSIDAGGADGALARDPVSDYLAALERLMIIEDQPAWAPHWRSRSRVRSASKRHCIDPSLACAALRATPEQ